MANFNAGIDPNLIKLLAEIATSLAKVDKTFDKVDSSLASFNKQVADMSTQLVAAQAVMTELSKSAVRSGNLIENAFGGKQGFRTFLNDVKSLDSRAIEGLRALSTTVSLLSRSIETLSRVGAAGTAIGQVSSGLMTIFNALKEGSKFEPAPLNNVITVVTGAFQQLSGAGFKDSLRLSVNAITGFINALDKLETVDLGSVQGNLIRLARGDVSVVSLIISSIDQINTANKKTSALTTGAVSSVNAIAEFMAAVARIDRLQQDGSAFDVSQEVKKIVAAISDSLTALGSFKEGSTQGILKSVEIVNKAIQPITNFIEQYVRLGTKTLDFNADPAKKTSQLKAVFTSLREVIDFVQTEANKIGEGGGTKFSTFNEVIVPIVSLMKSVSQTVNLFAKTPVSSKDVSQGISSVLKDIKNVVNYIATSFKDLEVLLKETNFTALGSTVIASIEPITKFIKSTFRLIAGLSDLYTVNSESIPNANKAVAGLFATLKSFFAAIGTAAKSFTAFDSPEAVAAFSNVMSFVTPLIASIRKIINFTKSLSSLDTELQNVKLPNATLLQKLMGVNKLTPVVQILQTVVKSFSGIAQRVNDAGSLPAFRALINSLKAVVEVVPQIVQLALNPANNFDKLNLGLVNRLFNLTALRPIFLVIGEVGKAFTGISNRIIRNTDLSGIESLVNSLKAVVESVPAIVEMANNPVLSKLRINIITRLLNLTKLRPIFNVISVVAKEFSKISGKLAGSADVSVVSTLSDAMSKVIRGVLSISNAAAKGAINPQRLRVATNAVKEVLRALTGIRVGDPKGYLDISKGVNNLILAYRSISEMSQIGGVKSANVKAAKEIATFINTFSGSLNLANLNQSSVKGLSSVSEGISSVVRATGNVSTLQTAGNTINKFTGNISVMQRTFAIMVQEKLAEQFAISVVNALQGIATSGSRAVSAVTGIIQDLSESLNTAGTSLLSFASDINSRFGIQSLIGGASFDIAAEYDDILTGIKVFAENLPFEEVQAFANEIGIKYPLSANQALAAILDLAKAGRSFPDIQNILPSAADLTALSDDKNLRRITQFLISSTQIFSEFSDGVSATFDNISQASDIVFRAANVSTLSVDELVTGLLEAGPAARRFNITLEEQASFLGQIRDAGVEAGRVGTLLATVLGEISKPKAREELERLGVAYADQNGNFRSLADILPEVALRYRQLGLSQLEVSNSLAEIGGDKFGQQGLTILLNAGGVEDFIADMNAVTLSTQEAAEVMFTSYRGALEQLRGSFETVQNSVLQTTLNEFALPLVKAMRFVVDQISMIPQDILNAVARFSFITATVVTATAAVAALTGGILLLTGAIGKMVLFFLSIRRTFALLTRFVTVFSTAGLVALTVFASGVFTLSQLLDAFNRGIADTTSSISKSFNRVKDQFSGVAESVRFLISRIGSAAKVVFNDVFGGDLEERSGLVVRLLDTVGNAFERVNKTINNIRNSAKDSAILDGGLIRFFAKVRLYIEPFVDGLAKIGAGITDLLRLDFSFTRVRDGVGDIGAQFARVMQQLVGGDFYNSIALLDNDRLGEGFAALFDDLVSNALTVAVENEDRVRQVTNFLTSILDPFSKLSSIFGAVNMEGLQSFFAQLSTSLRSGIENVVAVTLRVLSGQSLGTAISDVFGQAGKAVAFFADSVGDALQSVGSIISSFVDFFTGLFSSESPASGKVKSFEKSITDAFSGMGQSIKDFNDNTLRPLANQVSIAFNAISIAMRRLAPVLEPISDLFNKVGTSLSSAGQAFSDALSSGLGLGTAIDKFITELNPSKLLAAIPEAFSNMFKELGRITNNQTFFDIGVLLEGGISAQEINALLLDVAEKVKTFILNLPSTVGGAITQFGLDTGNDFLVSLGNAISNLNVVEVATLLAGKLLEMAHNALISIVTSLADLFDQFLDRFENRYVAGFVMLFGAAIALATPTILAMLNTKLVLPLIAWGQKKLAVIGAKFGLTYITAFLSALTLGKALIIGAFVGFAAFLLNAMFNNQPENDPNVVSRVEHSATSVANRYVEAYNKAVAAQPISPASAIFAIGDAAVNINNQFKDLQTTVFANVDRFTENLNHKIYAALYHSLGEGFASAVFPFVNIFTQTLNILGRLVANFIGAVGSVIFYVGKAINIIGSLVEIVIQQIGYAVNTVGKVINFIGSVIGNAISIPLGLIRNAAKIGELILGSVATFIGNLFRPVVDFFKSIGDAIGSIMGEIGRFIAGIGGMTDGLKGLGAAIPVLFVLFRVFRTKLGGIAMRFGAVFLAISGIFRFLSELPKRGLFESILLGFYEIAKGIAGLFPDGKIFGLDISGTEETIRQLGFVINYYVNKAIEEIKRIGQEALLEVLRVADELRKMTGFTPQGETVSQAMLRVNEELKNIPQNAEQAIDALRTLRQIELSSERAGQNNPLFLDSIIDLNSGAIVASIEQIYDVLNKETSESMLFAVNAARYLDRTALSSLTNRLDASEFLSLTESLFRMQALEGETPTFAGLTDLVNLVNNLEGDALTDFMGSSIFDINQNQVSAVDTFAEFIEAAIELGKITEMDVAPALERLNLVIADGQVVAREHAAEIINANYSMDEFLSSIRQEALEEFNNAMAQGAQDADHYADALGNLAEQLDQSLDAARSDRLSELDRQLQEGLIDEGLYAVLVREALEEVFDQGMEDVKRQREELFESFNRGLINREQFERQINELETYANQLQQDRDIDIFTANVRVRVANKLLTPAEGAQEVANYIKELQEAADGAGDSGGRDSTTPADTQPAEEQIEVVQELRDQYMAAEEEGNKLLEDRNKLFRQIQELEADYLQDKKEEEDDFHRESIRREEDYREQLLKIEEEGADSLIDAVNQRDSAAAQAAVKNRNQRLKEQQQEFEKEKKRREEDFKLDQQRAERDKNHRKQELMLEVQQINAEINAKQAAAQRLQTAIVAAEQERARAILSVLGQFRNMTVDQFANMGRAAVDVLHKAFPQVNEGVFRMANSVITAIQMIANAANRSPAVNPMGSMLANTGIVTMGNIQIGREITRASGGTTRPDTLYRVGEREPELLRQGGKLYLIPSQLGHITPPRPVRNNGVSTTNNSNITIDLGGITVQGAGSMNPQQLASEVERIVIPKIAKTIRDSRL